MFQIEIFDVRVVQEFQGWPICSCFFYDDWLGGVGVLFQVFLGEICEDYRFLKIFAVITIGDGSGGLVDHVVVGKEATDGHAEFYQFDQDRS